MGHIWCGGEVSVWLPEFPGVTLFLQWHFMMLDFHKVAEKHGGASLSREISRWAVPGICRLITLST